MQRKHQISFLLIALITIGICFFIGQNSFPWETQIHVSKESGFYNQPFFLKMTSTKGSRIYYTLDGTSPNKNSMVYSEPLLINDATPNKNTYSMHTDVSTGFYSDLIEMYQSADPAPGYQAPDEPVDKCTVIRAVAIDTLGNKSKEFIGSYFVTTKRPKKNTYCNTISLVTEPSNLFDKDTGIYVTGNTFKKALEKGEIDGGWRYWDANYRQRGKKSERPAYINVFDKAQNHVLDKNIHIRIRGWVSRAYLPKGLNLYAVDENDKNTAFGYSFFDNEYNPKSISLTSGGNQTITQFNDYMMTDRIGQRNVSVTQYRPYKLYINGEYWGFYWLSEKFENDYFAYHYNVDSNDVAMIKNGRIEIGPEEELTSFQRLEDFIIHNDMSYEPNYQKVWEQIDQDSFLDYFAIMAYIARNEDWPRGNEACWKTRQSKDSENPYADGKWRYIVFDCNSPAMGLGSNVEFNSFIFLLERDERFRSLWNNSQFRQAFINRLLEVGASCFSEQDMNDYIEKYTNDTKPYLAESWKRFYGSNNNCETEYEATMETVKYFFEHRMAALTEIVTSINE